MQNLEELRQKIMDIDREIIAGLAERRQIALEIGRIKAENHLPVLDKTRETQLFANYAELGAQQGLSADFIQALFILIFAHSRDLQQQCQTEKK